MAARVAHNHEVPGSNPGPATRKRKAKNAKDSDSMFFVICFTFF